MIINGHTKVTDVQGPKLFSFLFLGLEFTTLQLGHLGDLFFHSTLQSSHMM